MPERRLPPAPLPVHPRMAPGAGPRPNSWALDNRHGHTRFYPAVGYPVSVLPPGFISFVYRDDRYFFQSGIWYQPGLVGYVVARPPTGIVVSVLPPYTTVLRIGNVRYYYANEVYYVAVPGGYSVSVPPEGSPIVADTSSSPPSNATGPYPEGTWYFCESSAGYYPYVSECAEGWQPVPAVPRALLPRLSSTPAYPEGTWYYCESARNHYPYVTDCPEGWRAVPAAQQPVR